MYFCFHCGYRLSENSDFCPNCGTRLMLAPPVAEALPTAPAQAPAGPVQAQAAPAQPLYGAAPQAAPIPYGSEPAPFGRTPGSGAYGPIQVRRPAAPPRKPVDPMARAYRLTTLGTLVTYGVSSQVSQIVTTIAAWICLLFFAGGLSLSGFDSIFDLLGNSALVRILLLVYLFAYVGGLLLGLLISKTIRRRLPAQPPERRPLSAAAFLRCALAAFGLWGVGVLIGNFPSFIVPIESMDFGWNSIPLWILAILVAPIFEELIFRKLVLDRVGVFGEAPAVLCSALIFGLAHQNAGQFFLAFLLGLLFARIYLRTGNIVYTMLLHFMINLTATLDEVGTLIWGSAFELWFLIFVGVLAVAGIVLLIVFRRDPILGQPERLGAEERRNALRAWPVTLVKWICLYSIILMGLLYTVLAVLGGSFEARTLNPLGLLHIIPPILAVIFILRLTRRPKLQSAAVNAWSAPIPAAEAPASEAESPVPVEEAPASEAESPVPAEEAPAPAVEAPASEAESPVPAEWAPMPVAEDRDPPAPV